MKRRYGLLALALLSGFLVAFSVFFILVNVNIVNPFPTLVFRHLEQLFKVE